MLPMYYFELKTKIFINGELWGYELKSMTNYINFLVIVKNDEFIYLVKAGFISRVQLNDAGNPTFIYGRKSFDTMRSRNLKVPPITGEYIFSEHSMGGWLKSNTNYMPVLIIDGLYTDTSKTDAEVMSKPIVDTRDGRIIGYRLYCLNTHETYSLSRLETHHILDQGFIPGICYSSVNPSFSLVLEDELAEIYDFSGLPVFDLANDDCERPSGGYLERTDIFESRRLKKLMEQVNQDYENAIKTGETDNPILAAVMNYFDEN